MIRLLLSFLCFSVCSLSADEVIWRGKVESNGTPTKLITLKTHEEYQIKASGFINLGKWKQAGEALANDACFEFSEKFPPEKFQALKNSNEIDICKGEYHPDHVYVSAPFVAKDNRIFFWVNDLNYDDNSGDFEVEVIHKGNK